MTRRPRSQRGLTSLAGCLVVLLGLHAALRSEGLADPLPLRRIAIKADRLAKELERVDQGVLVQMPREEFESLVAKAAQNINATREVPRVLEAVYRANLLDQALAGTLEWKVLNPGPGAALWPLQPLNLALRQPRFEDQEALIADFDGRSAGLLLVKPGRRSVFVEWSLRGEIRPDGLSFLLEVPAAPVAYMELDLPQGQVVSVLNEAVLVTGPHPTEQGKSSQRWRIACGGRAQLNLLIRETQGNRPAVIVVKRQRTTQELTPGALEAAFEFDLAVVHQPAREIRCECDPRLRPYEVTLGNREVGWDLQPPARPGQPSILVVDPREPFWEGQLVVRCLASLDGAETGTVAWTSPTLRLAGALQRGETLVVRLHPDMQMRDWDPGNFQLVESASEPQRWQRLVLEGGGVQPDGAPAGTPPRRPSARVRAAGTIYRARQIMFWQLAPPQASLTLQIAYEIQQGRLFQLPILLPADWEVERVEFSTPGLLRNWSVRPPALPLPGAKDKPAPHAGRSTLLVDLQKPLAPLPESGRRSGSPRPAGGTEVAGAPRARFPVLTVRLHNVHALPLLGREVQFPQAEPLGAHSRDGALAIEFDEQVVQPTIKASVPEGEPEAEGLWGNRPPDFYFPFSGQPVHGSLLLNPRPPLLRARCTSDVFLATGRAAIESRLALDAELGQTDQVVVEFSASGAPWNWRVENEANAIRRAERLPDAAPGLAIAAMAFPHPLGRASLLTQRFPGERWRLTFARPLRLRDTVVILATRKLDRGDGAWHIPLPRVVGADPMDGEIALHLVGANILQVEANDLREAPPGSVAAGSTNGPGAWRTFRYGAEPAHLTLRGQPGDTDRIVEASADNVHLTTFVGLDGLLRHHFRFDVANWPQRRLPLPLPAGSRPVAARVDNCWLTPVPMVETELGDLMLELPVPERYPGDADSENVHRFEVVYNSSTHWSVFARVRSPAPILPIAGPISFRRAWRLPPGVSPMFDGQHRRLPGPGEGSEPRPPGRWPTDLFRLSAFLPRGRMLTQQSLDQRSALAEAVLAQGANRAGQTLSLGEVLEQISFHTAMQPWALLVDTEALREAGLGPDNPIKIVARPASAEILPPWDGLGLTVLHAMPAMVLTTRPQAEAWARAPGTVGPVSPALETALGEAAARGQDPSGRFRAAAAWVGTESGLPEVEVARRSLLGIESSLDAWTEWELLPGLGPDEEIVVVRREVVSIGGLLFAVLLVIGLGRPLRRIGRRRLAYLLAWLAAAGLALLWLPASLEFLAWWSLVLGLVIGLGWYVRAATRGTKPDHRSRSTGPGMAVAGIFLVATLGWAFQGASPVAPAPVFIVGGPNEPIAKQTVLAPAEVVERLRNMARPVPVPPPGAYLLSASYEGKVAGNDVEFQAAYQIFNPNDGPATLALPLGGLGFRLQSTAVLLDGARVLPKPDLPPPQPGFTLIIPSGGRHKVELTFLAPITDATPERQVQFTAPRLVQNQLRLVAPLGASFLQALFRQGRQTLTANPAGPSLDVSLGRIATPITLRWHQQGPAAAPARVQVREAYLWDLGVGASSLTGVIAYAIGPGAVTSLLVDLPPELEVRSVEVRRVGIGPVMRLRDWRIAANGPARSLQLDFPGPVSGDFEAVVEFLPTGPLPADLILPLPSPRGQLLPGGAFLAYRARGLAPQRTNLLRVTGINPADFAPFWPADSRPDPRSLTYVCAFRREPNAPPVLRLRLPAIMPLLQADQTLTCRVGPRQVDLQATLILTSPESEFALLEWELRSPTPLTITSVSGPGVRRWYQADDRITVWLNKACSKTQIDLKATSPLAVVAGRTRFDLPCFYFPAARGQTATVRLETAPGLSLAPESLRNLLAVKQPGPNQAFTSSQLEYGGSFQVRHGGAGTNASVLTQAEVRENRLVFSAHAIVRIPQGELRSVQMRLRHWEGEDLRLEAPRVAQRRDRHLNARDRSWTLQLQPGVTGTYAFSLSGSLPLENAPNGLAMPEITLSGIDQVDYWVALAGPELAGDGPAGLALQPNPATALAPWTGAAERLRRAGGMAWKVIASDWRLRLALRPRPVVNHPPQVFLVEQSAAVVDGQRWLHEATLWLRHETNTDLVLLMPEAAEFLAVAIDGLETSPLQPEPNRLWLPLPGKPGLRSVRLQWRYAKGLERFEAPLLKPPLPEGMTTVPSAWTLIVPPGWSASPFGPGPRLQAGADRAAALHLQKADAFLRIAKSLASQDREANGGQLSQVQRSFYNLCRRAEMELNRSGATAERDKGPEDQSLTTRRANLLASNLELAGQLGFEDLRAQAEASSFSVIQPTAPSPETGTRPLAARAKPGIPFHPLAAPGKPIYATNLPLNPSEPELPQVRLGSEGPPRDEAILNASVQWLGLLAGIWLLSFFPSVLGLAKPLWPEQIALLGLFGWYLAGPNPLAYIFLGLAFTARFLYLAGWSRWLFRGWSRDNSPSTSSRPSPSAGSGR